MKEGIDMRRRGFFGTLAGLVMAPFGVKAAEPEFDVEKSRQMGMSSTVADMACSCDAKLFAKLFAKLDKDARAYRENKARKMEDAFWGTHPKTFGIEYWLE